MGAKAVAVPAPISTATVRPWLRQVEVPAVGTRDDQVHPSARPPVRRLPAAGPPPGEVRSRTRSD